MSPIVIPLHPAGGKFGNNTEVRFALRSIERHFKGEFHLAVVSSQPPAWAVGVEWVDDGGKGLKTALRRAAERFPDGFFWWYDDCVLLRDQTPEELKVTLACRRWTSAKTKWARSLEEVRARLVKEGFKPWDYSRPHGPYWFDKGMVDETFSDWPGLAGKFPFESWILSKRDWPRRHGNYKQYYGAFKSPPSERDVLLNYNDKGATETLMDWLWQRFSERCAHEKPWVLLDGPLEVSVLDLESRPRYGEALAGKLRERGFAARVEFGTEGRPDWLEINHTAFKRAYKRGPLNGECGCFASHVTLARRMVAGDLPQFVDGWWVVTEDDAAPSESMNADALRRILSDVEGFDFVLLHPGRKGHRGKGRSRVGPVSWNKHGWEFGTFAYAVNEKGASEIAKFIMRHPIDHAVLNSRRVRTGVLWGEAHFTHPAAEVGVPAIRWEREKVKVGRYGRSRPGDLFDGKRVAIVGNAPTALANQRNIDGFDVVVRFNRFRLGEGFEALGTRTDVLAVPTDCSSVVAGLNGSKVGEVKWLLDVAASAGRERRANTFKLKKMFPGASVLDASWLVPHVSEQLAGGFRATSGITALAWFLESGASTVYLTGFGFERGARDHYFHDAEFPFNYTRHNPYVELSWLLGRSSDSRLEVDEHIANRLRVAREEEALAKEYKTLHTNDRSYGRGGCYMDQVVAWVKGRRLRSVLDYGCGKGGLVLSLRKLKVKVSGYDPAVAEWSVLPAVMHDGVVCLDVLEHLTEPLLREALARINVLARRTVILNVSTRAAVHCLPNGRNCHETVRPATWWRNCLEEHLGRFKIAHDHDERGHYLAVLEA